MGDSQWTFLTNHGHVLLCLARRPDSTLRDVARDVGITERAVQRIVADLEAGGYLQRSRTGRQNTYQIDGQQHLRHPIEAHQSVASLLALAAAPVTPPERARRRRKPSSTGRGDS